MKNEKSVHLYPLGTFSTFYYVFFVSLGGYNSSTTKDIKLKFSAFLSCVEVTKCVKFQIPRLMGFKVGIFRISHIDYQPFFFKMTLTLVNLVQKQEQRDAQRWHSFKTSKANCFAGKIIDCYLFVFIAAHVK